MRSGSMVQWLRLVGWDAQALAGGYKTWRRHVMNLIDERAPRLDLRVVCGATGSAKTRVLQALADDGAQVIDLEALAVHKGSVLGGVPGRPQPSQKMFETGLADALQRLDPARPVYIEAESRKIGSVALPNALVDRMRAAACIEIDAPPAARLAFLLGDYAYLGDDPAALAALLGQLHGLQANETLARWQQWAAQKALAPLFEELMALHYDPLYARSQQGSYLRLAQAQRVAAPVLDAAGIAAAAAAVRACG
jgi:tRNA 2-selenouridine synthase